MLWCLLWCRGVFQMKDLEKTQFHELGVAGTIAFAFDWCQRYWKCLQQSNSRRKASAQESSVLRSEQNKLSVLSEELSQSFQSYNTLMDTCSITISRYWLLHYNATISWCKNWRIASQKVNQKFHRLVSTLHAATSLKAVLHFDFVNTFGQKPCTLHAHFTQSYSALDTLPNHY